MLADDVGRRRLVGRFYGLHAGSEPLLEPLLAPIADLDVPARRRVPILERDLEALGLDADGLPLCDPEPPASPAEALGFLYVLEGSTLGGRIIRREMAARGQDGTGLDFLDPHGAGTGGLWRDFLTILRRECPAADEARVEAAIRGGIAGFATAESWLCGPENG